MPNAKKTPHYIKEVEAAPDFSAIEKELLEHWYRDGIVTRYLHKNDSSSDKFIFQDGPITANNPMGVHHAWGRTYKDLWQRYKNMRGFKQRFQNGFDCQGLWVEVEVEKELGFRTKKDIEAYGVDKFVQLCKDRVKKYSLMQTQQSKRLGYFMDWDNSYFTMSDENNYMIWNFLKVCWQKGWIYQGHDSVPWCPRCETAISQHEMLTEDYKEITHKSIYYKLPITGRDREYLLVWTTTPWTLPANIAVAVDSSQEYALVEDEAGSRYWILNALVTTVFKDTLYKILKSSLGSDLVGLRYTTAFDNIPAVKEVADKHPEKFHVVIATDSQIMPITAVEGTGLVHTAVSAGAEDFQLGKKLGLPLIPVIADNADYLAGMGFLSGKNAKKHPEIIIDYLNVEGQWVFRVENYTHRYPSCWRCKTELVWKIADVWYISMDKTDPDDKQGRTLRQKMIDVAKKIHWYPEFGMDRELDWLNNMHDWLISKKNRYWGLALPIWVCDDCSDFIVIGGKEELKNKASDGWDKFIGHTPHKPFIDEVKIKCEKCGGNMTRIGDVGNPWLDAGIVPFSTLVDPDTGEVSYSTDKKYWRDWYPANFITESFPGQFKNWFYSLIAMSTVFEDATPYENVLGFASVLGEDGRAMHKSWGNSIEFNEGADKIGVDVMRWTFVRHNPERNLLFGYKTTSDTKRLFHMLLWNSYRFFANYAALEKWDSTDKNYHHPSKLDFWITYRLNQVVIDVGASLDKYDAFSATNAIESFVSDLSTWYIRRSRDRIGPVASDCTDKDNCYLTLNNVFSTLSRILMPFIPFLSDLIFTNITGEETVHLADWPETTTDVNTELQDRMSQVRSICELGNSARKTQGIAIKQPLSSIKVVGDFKNLVDDNELLQLIKDELNVEQVIILEGETPSVEYDTEITDNLQKKGRARELIRAIQEARKEANCRLDEHIRLEMPDWPEEFVDDIKKKTLVDNIATGDSLKIIRSK